MCVLRKRFWCFHSLNFAFHTLFIPHIQAAVAAAFNGYKSHFESQTGFCKTDKRESKITALAHTNHIWLGLESAIRHWKTLTIDCACECVCGNGRSLFSTTITNAFILPLKKHKNVLTYHHPCVCILQMDSLPFFFFFVIRIVSIVRNDFLCYFFSVRLPFVERNVFYDFTIFILVDFHSASETHFKRISKSDERYSKCANHYCIERALL